MKIKIVITDDHPLVISGMRHILKDVENMEIIGSYTNGKELIASIERNQPTVLLLDIQMPGQAGDELAAIINEKYPKIKIIALTNLDSVFYIQLMLKVGAMGYILKTAKEEILLAAIRSVAEGEQYIEPVLLEKLKQNALQSTCGIVKDKLLSRREKEILQLLATNHNSKEIAEQLYLSKRTVDNHRYSLLMKLDVKNTAGLIWKAAQMGLININ